MHRSCVDYFLVVLRQEAGLPLGGADFNPYVMLEVHYNNPEHKSGFVDSSGIRFYVSPRLKQMDAGVIELGLEYTDKMAIPPGQESFQLTGYCVSECTAVVNYQVYHYKSLYHFFAEFTTRRNNDLRFPTAHSPCRY